MYVLPVKGAHDVLQHQSRYDVNWACTLSIAFETKVVFAMNMQFHNATKLNQ